MLVVVIPRLVLGQTELTSKNKFSIGLIGQLNSYHDNNGTQIYAEPGFTFDSSNGLGLNLSYSRYLGNIFIRLTIINRYAKVVDNIALPDEPNKYKVVQDASIGLGKTFKSANSFLNNVSLTSGVTFLSIGQPYEGGLILIPGYDLNGNQVYKEYKPSTIQFPAISIGVSKVFFTKWTIECEYLMYDGEWRQDLVYFNFGSIVRATLGWSIIN